MWWLLLQILVLWWAVRQTGVKCRNSTSRKYKQCSLSASYVFKFKYVSSAFSFCWNFFLRGRGFVLGASEPCRPPVYLLFGLKINTFYLFCLNVLTKHNNLDNKKFLKTLLKHCLVYKNSETLNHLKHFKQRRDWFIDISPQICRCQFYFYCIFKTTEVDLRSALLSN